MDLAAYVERLRGGAAAKFPANANSVEFARTLDAQDSLSHLRDEFILPTKASIKKTALDGTLPCMLFLSPHASSSSGLSAPRRPSPSLDSFLLLRLITSRLTPAR